MTKADFLAGKPFKINYQVLDTQLYKYDPEHKCVYSGFMNDVSNSFINIDIEGWVNKIGTKSINVGKFVFHKRIKLNIRFEDMILVE